MYSIKQVSELLDIPAVTIRAWENRYNIVTPTRTEGGHRLYSNKDFETLKWLKNQMDENNLRISEAIRLFKRSAEPPRQFVSPTSKGYREMIDQLYKALINLEVPEANRITDLAFSLYDYEEVFHQVLVKVLYKVGDDWENGIITVAQEHFASQFIMNRCTQFFRVLPVDPSLPKVLAFCPAGEHHHIGLMIFSLFLRKKGNEVIYLGPNTPFEGLSELIPMKEISVVAISLSNPGPLEELENWIQSVLETNPSTQFILGGAGVTDHLRFDPKSVSYSLGMDWEEWYRTFM